MPREMNCEPFGADCTAYFPPITTKHKYKIIMEFCIITYGPVLSFYVKQIGNNKWYNYIEVNDFCGDLGLSEIDAVIWTLKFGKMLPTHALDVITYTKDPSMLNWK